MSLFKSWRRKRKKEDTTGSLKELSHLQEAERVLYFFREISCIPRASYDEKRISNYLVAFARARDLEVYQDKHYNVVIKKPATIANCTCPPVIIQGHMDMVYVQSPSCRRNYEEGIAVMEKDGWLCADGTTLGADNGIAVAYGLALLDSTGIPHPDLELVFTVQEEVGMFGAEKLDCAKLKGRYFINLDTENEGVFFTSCAGAVRTELDIPVKRKKIKTKGMKKLTLTLGGLSGGHSGMEIHQLRGNAIVLMTRLLKEADAKGVYLRSMECDGKMNAIASSAKAVLYVEKKKLNKLIYTLESTVEDFKRELGENDNVELTVKTKKCKKKSVLCYTKKSRKRVLNAISLLPNGVLNMTGNEDCLVETSANIGVMTQKDDKLVVCSAIRSSVGTRKRDVAERYKTVAKLCGGKCRLSGDYPQWEYRENSPLRQLAMETYRETFGKEPKSMGIHAGLECGYFDKKLADVDIVSFGPDQEGVHTPNEKANIQSVERVWQLLQRMLEKLGTNQQQEEL